MDNISLDDLVKSSGTATQPAAGSALATAAGAPAATPMGLPEPDQARVTAIAQTIDFTKAGIESSYAKDVQRKSAGFADEILSKTASKDTGKAGELLQQLVTTVDNEEFASVRKVPILGTVVVSVNKLRRRYQKVADQIDDIVVELERAQSQMATDIAMYETMYRTNAQQYDELRLYVLAGRQALAQFREEQLPRLDAEAAAANDPMQAQVLKDFKDKLNRFDKRLDDLDRISVVALQTAPQIKIIQNADQMISDKIDTTITTTIPVWKSQMVIALGLEHQRKALDLQKRADDVTNKLLEQNAAALHQGAVDAAEATERAVVDTETLERVNQELISTLKETVEIQKRGRENRAAAQQQMRKMETDLKNALIEVARS